MAEITHKSMKSQSNLKNFKKLANKKNRALSKQSDGAIQNKTMQPTDYDKSNLNSNYFQKGSDAIKINNNFKDYDNNSIDFVEDVND